MKIRFSPEAVADLSRLRAFIESKNPIAAQRIANELLKGIEKLKVFPEIGLKVVRAPQPHLIRDLFVGDYTIRNLIGDNEIYILRMWHGKEIEKDL
jgi:plasmid stabilization system protein ParE